MSGELKRGVGSAALVCSILASALAQLLLKTGVSLAGDGLLASGPGLWWISGGLVAYALSLAAWLVVLARFPLSLAYPLLSLSYVLVYLGAIASPLLAEELTPLRAAGVLLVACGAAVVSATREKQLPVTKRIPAGD